MKKSLPKQLLILIAFPALLLSFTVLPGQTNFSGEWKLNTDKSDLGQMANFAVTSLKVDQANEAITIARTAPTFQGDESTTTETVTFDGKTSETKIFGESTKKSSIKWDESGKTFTLTFTLNLDFNGQQMVVEGTEKWSLSDDGKILTLETNSTSDFGDMSTTAVYDKK